MGFYDVLNGFSQVPNMFQSFPTAPHFVPCLFLAQVSKQACLLACNAYRWAKGEKKIV
jgi:hypothetical protein